MKLRSWLKAMLALVVTLTTTLVWGAPPTGTEAVDCEVKTVPCVITATWGNQSTTKADAEEVCLFKNLKITDIVGLSATSYRAFGGNSFQNFAIDTIYPAGRPTEVQNNYDYKGFYYWSVAEDGQTATFQVQTKANQGYNGCLSGIEFVQLRQVGSDIWGSVYGIKYVYGLYYGDDATSKSQSNSCKYYYDDDSMNSGHAVFNFSLQDLKAYYYPATGDLTVTFVGMDGTTIDTQTVAAGGAATAPTPPTVDGYVFYQWDTDFSSVRMNLTVTALYHKLCTVQFVDYDGTVLKTQTGVEETTAATAPEDPTREGYTFNGWDTAFDAVADDLTVTATYLENFTVRFYKGVDGVGDGYVLVSEQTVPEGKAATAPADSEAAIDGYVFKGWGSEFSSITADTTVYGVYNKLWTVHFVEEDGTTELEGAANATQSVENGAAAAEPNLDAYTGTAIVGWDPEDFSNVTADMTIKAVHGAVPEVVTQVANSGKLAEEDASAGILIWNGGVSGVWDDATKNWYNLKGMAKVWQAGATAVFPNNATVTVSGTQSVGKIITLMNASEVTFSGDELDFVSSGVVRFGCDSKLAFANAIGGEVGMTTAVDEATAATETEAATYCTGTIEISGTYLSTGALTIASGTVVRTTGTGVLGTGGVMTANVYAAGELRIASDGTQVKQEFKNYVNCKMADNNRYAITMLAYGPVICEYGSYVVVNNSSEYSMRFGAPLLVYGEAEIKNGCYHAFYQNPYGITVEDGGVLRLYQGYGVYGHRGLKITCNKGGTLWYGSVTACGSSDTTILNGGTIDAAFDYSANIYDDTFYSNLYLNDGATLQGKIVNAAHYFADNKFTVGGTSPSSIVCEQLRFGSRNQTASASMKKMKMQLVVADVTASDAEDLTITSTLFKHPNTTWATGNEEYCGIEKTGAGTVLFTASDSALPGGSLKAIAGTVKFGDDAQLDGMQLWMQGGKVDFGKSKGSEYAELKVTADSDLVLGEGGKVTFADSSAIAWTEGAVLRISGTLGNKSVRIGTSAAAVTADQLAQIKQVSSSGTLRPVTISSEGYLLLSNGFNLILR